MSRKINEKVGEFRGQFLEIGRKCQQFCFMARGREFQVEAVERLETLKQEAAKLKEEMIAQQDEDAANEMLAYESMIDGLVNELKMWVALKDDDPNEAWDRLIEAQDSVVTAMQVHDVASHLTRYAERLHVLEQLLFPPQIFVSPGMTYGYSECSICGGEYGECEHVVGRAYMGKMCTRIIKEIKLREVSIVKDPTDKRRRMITFPEGGVRRDVMTWRAMISQPSTSEGASDS